MGELSRAEEAFQYVLKHDADNLQTHERLAFVYGVTGQRWDAASHLFYEVQHRDWRLETLVMLGDGERPIEEPEYLKRCEARAPHDPLVRFGLAANAISKGRTDEARAVLGPLVRDEPELVAGQALLGALLVVGSETEFFQWHEQLPAAARSHPEINYVRGLWARRQGKLEVAARCFWEVVKRVPEHRRGTYQLGQVLVALGRSPGDDFEKRASQLYELSLLLDRVLLSQGKDAETMRQVAVLLEAMGRLWEAGAWAETSLSLNPYATWPIEMIERLSPELRGNPPRTLDNANLALRYDLSSLPTFATLQHRSSNPDGVGSRITSVKSRIAFEEADSVGFDFAYDNGGDVEIDGARFFEQTGGGVGVMDFDQDGWPDLYMTQGARWKTGDVSPTPSSELIDRMFRNLSGTRFVDATSSAGLGDEGFGQGCAAGDFDNDGFQDLYVANIGRNRLYRNNGDGTFNDVTANSGLAAEEWTTSCAFVDLNADGLPDLFDVNYLTGSDIYTAICDGFACSPKGFEGVPDRVLLNRGDGTFVTLQNATPQENAKGLGVLAAVLHERDRPSLFIANDQVPNFLLRNVPAEDPANVRFVEEGFLSGLAFDENGLPMACMGIAADDINSDGRTDFFVTNFKDEYNTLYLQDGDGLFVDGTNAAGLRSPSLPFVGWGTQFLDADLDGEPDLVLTNGHVDDYRRTGGQYQMRPQFFQNEGNARFIERLAPEAGTYFAREFVGRGLARLDFNGDGLMDFAVSNIGDKASLVANRSTETGHFVNVRLHATRTARDAIGTQVELQTTDGRRWSKQLTAGDGYMASNERFLQFGIGTASGEVALRIEWPSGRTTELKYVPINATIHIIEDVGSRETLRQRNAASLAVR
ncbi:MAG: FG-GAP-like repeat-containing protein [Planctomycetota bacterium]|nr:FG-GAP-like repeat-containing protein [Planctomycetota bacterium]